MYQFDSADPATLSDAALNESISGWARAEAAAAAKRLAYIAELVDRRCDTALGRDRELWACDAWDSTACEVAAELMISHRAASTLMHQGLALRDRLPRVGALLAQGFISLRVATTITWRTLLIEDPDVLARVDADFAAAATTFGKLSEKKLTDALDSAIEKHDPDAVRRFRTAERTMDVRFGDRDDATGTRSIYGRLYATDAELLDRRVDALVRSVCPDDPRSLGQRRSEAFGVIAVNGDALPCLCGKPGCPAASRDPRGEHITIHVLTDDTNDADVKADAAAGAPRPQSSPCPPTSVVAGGGVVPAPLLAELRRMNAVVRPIADPADLIAESGYRPATALTRFVRARYLTCCFPGCDYPAEYCDLDHTNPYDASRLTHPGNIKCLCRKHHHLKTFWVGRGGWTDEQLADGTVVWTTPAGLRKTVPPGSRTYFPGWCPVTPIPAPLPPPPDDRTIRARDLKMPLRKRTRAQQHADRVRFERESNAQFRRENPPPF